jgi:ribonuclease J
MSHGFVGPDEERALLDGVVSLIAERLGGEGNGVDWTTIHDTMKSDVAAYLYAQTHRRPLVLPVMVEV